MTVLRPFEYCALTWPFVATLTPVKLPTDAPFGVALVSVEGLSNCVRPFDEPTVPMLTDNVCEARPEVADQGMVTDTLPVAGLAAAFALASVPSELNVIVPWAIGLVDVMFVGLP